MAVVRVDLIDIILFNRPINGGKLQRFFGDIVGRGGWSLGVQRGKRKEEQRREEN